MIPIGIAGIKSEAHYTCYFERKKNRSFKRFKNSALCTTKIKILYFKYFQQLLSGPDQTIKQVAPKDV